MKKDQSAVYKDFRFWMALTFMLLFLLFLVVRYP